MTTSPGCVMVDLAGLAVRGDERALLKHSLIGGVILFSRNYESPQQLAALVREIHALRTPRLLVAVDQEGGRVQRLKRSFTRLPPMGALGQRYDQDRRAGLALAEKTAWVMATELRAVGIDFSFAPVLDLRQGLSEVIGDRALHRAPENVAVLARAYISGLRRAGLAAVGKHFPGHGSVREDSHAALPVDGRRLEHIEAEDMIPFARLVDADLLAAIMPAHIVYPQIDDRPASFSSIWLREILRGKLGFRGAIFSDDLSMAGAESIGAYTERAACALQAGCDMVLVCNNRDGVLELLEHLEVKPSPNSGERLTRLYSQPGIDFSRLHNNHEWRLSSREVASLITENDTG